MICPKPGARNPAPKQRFKDEISAMLGSALSG